MTVSDDRFSTMAEAFRRTAAAYPDQVAIRTEADEVSWTWAQLREQVDDVAAGLHELGLRRGQTVAILLTNRPEFHLCDLAAMMLGAPVFSLYQTSPSDQIAYLLNDSAAQVVITERRFLDVLRGALGQAPSVRHVVLVDPEGADTEYLTLEVVRKAGRTAGLDVDASVAALRPDDVLTLIYTSGTTGSPKGVELTHGNLVASVAATANRFPMSSASRVISWLPAAHIAERAAHHYLPIVFGMQVTCCPDPGKIGQYLQAVQPTWFFGVPRIWEKIRSGVLASLDALPPEQGERAKAAVEAGITKVRLEQRGEPVPDTVAEAVTVAERELFAGLRARIGFGSLANAHVGAAPTPPEVLEFFHAIGIPLAEIWGMSETCGTGTSNPPDRIRIGTVGLPSPGVELKLGEDGEILLRGSPVMRGYRNMAERTAEAVVDGWLHTGDIGTIDQDGYVRIVDRKKELIINAAGKNMSPATIEARIKTCADLIGQACCIGDGRPYNTALIVLDPDAATAWAARHGIAGTELAELATDDRVRTAVQAGIDAANEYLSRPEQIKKFHLVPGDWLPAGDELTPTMKLKRTPIERKYATEIAAMYAGGR